MPTMGFCAGSNDLCYRCNRPGDPKLRTCSRCQVARYCSIECQKEDWTLTHKKICVDHKTTLKNHPDSSMEDKLKVFLKWLDLWRDALLAWAAFSADLANRPPEYLLTHRWGFSNSFKLYIIIITSDSHLVEVERRPPAEKHSTRSKFLVRRLHPSNIFTYCLLASQGCVRWHAHRRRDAGGVRPQFRCGLP